MNSIYQFTVPDTNNEEVTLSKYRGKVLLIVNVASKCGFTPQYQGLQALKTKFPEDFEILAFPCNQFKQQEPGTNKEIKEFCEMNFGITFPIFGKIDVNGKNTHPLYAHLKEEKKGLLGSQAIKWNFTKFLVDREGNVLHRFSPLTKPEEIEIFIQRYLN